MAKPKTVSGIIKKTIADMKSIGTYKDEFMPAISRYADMRLQFDILNKQWYDDGCRITEPYTNKAGATNERKTALYLSLETLRKELLEMENLFGLTPAGLKKIKTDALKIKGESAFIAALKGIESGME